MAMEQCFQEVLEADGGGDGPLQKWKSITPAATAAENVSACFDCNICLDFAQDPVVTLCGHLYCWPCICKWLHLQTASTDPDKQQLCPVCKADISLAKLVPLYGRGQSAAQTESTEPKDLVIPHRPPACGVNSLIAATSTTSHPDQQLHGNDPYPYRPQAQSGLYHRRQFLPNQFNNYAAAAASPAMFNLGGTTMNSVFHPMVGMFGEMVYARVFGNSEATLFAYPNSSYHRTSSSSPRMRRQEMQANKSLNRISIFLFCCFVLCLLLF